MWFMVPCFPGGYYFVCVSSKTIQDSSGDWFYPTHRQTLIMANWHAAAAVDAMLQIRLFFANRLMSDLLDQPSWFIAHC